VYFNLLSVSVNLTWRNETSDLTIDWQNKITYHIADYELNLGDIIVLSNLRLTDDVPLGEELSIDMTISYIGNRTINGKGMEMLDKNIRN